MSFCSVCAASAVDSPARRAKRRRERVPRAPVRPLPSRKGPTFLVLCFVQVSRSPGPNDEVSVVAVVFAIAVNLARADRSESNPRSRSPQGKRRAVSFLHTAWVEETHGARGIEMDRRLES